MFQLTHLESWIPKTKKESPSTKNTQEIKSPPKKGHVLNGGVLRNSKPNLQVVQAVSLLSFGSRCGSGDPGRKRLGCRFLWGRGFNVVFLTSVVPDWCCTYECCWMSFKYMNDDFWWHGGFAICPLWKVRTSPQRGLKMMVINLFKRCFRGPFFGCSIWVDETVMPTWSLLLSDSFSQKNWWFGKGKCSVFSLPNLVASCTTVSNNSHQLEPIKPETSSKTPTTNRLSYYLGCPPSQ